MPRLLVAEIPENAARDLAVERAILGDDVEILRYTHQGEENDLIKAARDADIVLTDFVPFTRRTIESMPRCRMICVAATGYSTIDLEAAADAGVCVSAISDYCTDEVADHAMLLMLTLCRRLLEYNDMVQDDHRWQFDALSGLRRTSELTLGIVGFGKIGKALAKRARAFGMTVIAFDPYADRAAADTAIELCELPELYRRSDIISLNCALTDATHGLLDAAAFAAMQRRPLLINCARGALIDEAALVDALDAGQVSGAGLDVLADESPDLSTSPFINRHNVILTPHVAFYSDSSVLENRRISAQNIRYFLDGDSERIDTLVVDPAR